MNSQAPGPWLRKHTPSHAAKPGLQAMDHGRLTARGLDRALRVAWTLADLEGEDVPSRDHVLRAMILRSRGA